jgi:hypothetical protein
MKKIFITSLLLLLGLWIYAQSSGTQSTTNFSTWSNPATPGGVSPGWTSASVDWYKYTVGFSDYGRIYSDNSTNQRDTLYTADIAIPGDPDSQTKYSWSFSFEWKAADFGNTNSDITPLSLGVGDVGLGFNYADIEVQYFDGLTWTSTVWRDVKDSLAKAEKLTGFSGSLTGTKFIWPNFGDAAAISTINSSVYKTTITLPASIKGKSNFKVRFIYTSSKYTSTITNRDFYIDNLKVNWMGPNPGPGTTGGYPVFEMSKLVSTNYTSIPLTQVSASYSFTPILKNVGWNKQDTTSLTMTLQTQKNADGYITNGYKVLDAAFISLATKSLQINKPSSTTAFTFSPSNKTADTYTIRYTLSGDTSDFYLKGTSYTSPGTPPVTKTATKSLTTSFATSTTVYRKHTTVVGNTFYISDSTKYKNIVGTSFDIINNDHLDNFNVSLSGFNAKCIISLLDKNGNTIYQSPERNINGAVTQQETPRNAANYGKPFLLDKTLSPYYIFVKNTGTNDLQVKTDNNGGTFFYGAYPTSSTTPSIDTIKGDLIVDMYLIANRAPALKAGVTTINLDNIPVGFVYSNKQLLKDDDNEAVQMWLRKNNTGTPSAQSNFPKSVNPINVPSWITITANAADTSFTISGTPTLADAGANSFYVPITDGADTVVLTYNITVNAPASTFATFNEDFISGNFTTNTWQVIKSTTAANNWSAASGMAKVLASDATKAQDETLYSKETYLPTLNGSTTDTVYYLAFDWTNDWTKNCSAASSNLADISISISSDHGATWTEIWQDDNQTLINANKHYSYTSEIPWPYTTGTTYHFGKDLTSLAGKSVMLKVNYKGQNGGIFTIDNVRINLENTPSVSSLAYATYSSIPYMQRSAQTFNMVVKNANLAQNISANYSARLVDGTTNQSVNTLTATVAPVAVNDTVNIALAGTFNTGYTPSATTRTFTIQNFTYLPGSSIIANPITLPVSSSFSVTYDEYAKDDASAESNLDPTTISAESLGSDFDIVANDHLSAVKFYDGINGSNGLTDNVSFDLYKVSGASFVPVTSISAANYTKTTSGFWKTFTFKTPLNVTPGKYVIMVNLVFNTNHASMGIDKPAVDLRVKNLYYYKGFGNVINKVEKNGQAMLRLILGNSKPAFYPALSALTATDRTSYEAIADTFVLNYSDANGDSIWTLPVATASNITGTRIPAWASISSSKTGVVITGKPAITDIGNNYVEIKFTDGRDTVSENFTILVKANPVPEFTSVPEINAKSGAVYSYKATARDIFGDALTLSSEKIPSWLTFTASTGILTGTPAVSNVGTEVVKLKVTDANGKINYQQFSILIVNATNTVTTTTNVAPKFTSASNANATQGVLFSHPLTASDANTGDVVTFSVSSSNKVPSWLSLSGSTLSGTPSAENVGENRVVIVASDGKTSTEQVFNINVQATNALPAFSLPLEATATVGTTYSYEITATDADAQTVTISTTKKPVWLQLVNSSNGKATLMGTPLADNIGANVVIVAVSDGNSKVEKSYTITVSAATKSAIITLSPIATNAIVGVEYTTLITALDSEGNELNFTANQLPSWLSLTNNQNGSVSLTGIPSDKNVGNNTVILSVSNGVAVTEKEYTILVEASKLKSTSAYPVPASNSISISGTEGSTITLFNSNGIPVKTVKGVSDISEIDLSGIDNGIYFVKIVDKNGAVTSQTISVIK